VGYFPNGMSGAYYQEHYCARCINEDAEKERWCPIWNWHLLDNYAECNKDDSYLHKLIPRKEDGTNGQCVMFVERQPEPEDTLPPKSTAANVRSMEQLRSIIKIHK